MQARRYKTFLGLVLCVFVSCVCGLSGCATSNQSKMWDDLGHAEITLRVLKSTQEQITFGWSFVNHHPCSVAFPRQWKTTNWNRDWYDEPMIRVIPPHDILFVFSMPRQPVEDTQTIEGGPNVKYRIVKTSERISGQFTIKLPVNLGYIYIATDSGTYDELFARTDEYEKYDIGFNSVFLFEGDYQHLPGVFSSDVNEVEKSIECVKIVSIAATYWLIDMEDEDGLPDGQGVYDRLYRQSVIRQAVYAKKYPADELYYQKELVEKLVASDPIKIKLPLRTTYKMYYSPPVTLPRSAGQ